MANETRVRHPKLGQGVVLRMRRGVHGHPEYEVDFGYIARWCPASELEDSERLGRDAQVVDTATPLPATVSPMDTSSFESRACIEALRLGQVPGRHVHELTVGWERLLPDLSTTLDRAADGKASRIVLRGAWGTGKSHALSVFRALARAGKFVVASIELDGRRVALSQPFSMYDALVSDFTAPDDVLPSGPLRFLEDLDSRPQAIPTLERRVPDARLPSLTRLLSIVGDDEEAQTLVEDYACGAIARSAFIGLILQRAGKVVYPRKIRVHSRAERPEQLVALLREWAELFCVLGYAGLAVTIDEFDVEYAVRHLTAAEEEMRDLILRALGGCRDAHLAIALASTPAAETKQNEALRHLPRTGIHDIPELEQADRAALVLRLVDRYQKAYDGRPPALDERIAARMAGGLWRGYERRGEAVVRNLVRATIEACDLITQGRARDWDAIVAEAERR